LSDYSNNKAEKDLTCPRESLEFEVSCPRESHD
jgi:hypothetical protein